MGDQSFEDLMSEMGVSPLGHKKSAKSDDPPEKSDFAPKEDVLDEAHGERELFLRAVQDLSPENQDQSTSQASSHSIKKIKRWAKDIPEPDETLDLHGCTKNEARERLGPVIKNAFLQRQKWVWVVTGKGLHSPGEKGILASIVEQWFQREGRRYIHTYGAAPRSQGGRGVWIVRIRQD